MNGADLGAGLARSLGAFLLVAIPVVAVTGWALIEGSIWLFNHLRLTVTP
jgi:hypothetical protein